MKPRRFSFSTSFLQSCQAALSTCSVTICANPRARSCRVCVVCCTRCGKLSFQSITQRVQHHVASFQESFDVRLGGTVSACSRLPHHVNEVFHGAGNVSPFGTYNVDRCTSWCRYMKSPFMLQINFPSSASKDASSRLLLFRLAQQAFRHGQVEDGQRV